MCVLLSRYFLQKTEELLLLHCIVKALLLFVLFFLIGCFGMLAYLHFLSNVPSMKHVTTAFSLEKAPSRSLVASIASLSGDVEWISRTATEPARLSSLKLLQQGEEIQTGKNGSISVVLQHKGVFTLSANTDVALVQTLPMNIVISQTSGTVVYTRKDTSPFSVRAGDLLINILSGTTDVYVDTKNKKVIATVRSGSITAAYTDTDNVSEILTARQAQALVYDASSQTAIVI